jgi:hypothetical protein
MKETYSLKEVKDLIRDVITISFDPNPDADFYAKLFGKYDEEMQKYVTDALLAALLAREFTKIATVK